MGNDRYGRRPDRRADAGALQLQHEDRERESLLRVVERLTALERRVDRIADYLNASRGAGDASSA